MIIYVYEERFNINEILRVLCRLSEQNVSMSFSVTKKQHHMVFTTCEHYLTKISLFFWRDFNQVELACESHLMFHTWEWLLMCQIPTNVLVHT